MPKGKTAPDERDQERLWLRFELCVDGPEKEELYQLLDRLHLTRRELALIVTGLRVRPGFCLADFDTQRPSGRVHPRGLLCWLHRRI